MGDSRLTGIPEGCEVLVVCEGRWDVVFLEEMYKHLGLRATPVSIGGKGNFHSRSILSICQDPRFRRLRAFGAVLDANGSASKTLSTVNGVLRSCLDVKPNFLQHGEVKPLESGRFFKINVGAFIMPDGKNSGELEDMLLASIRESHPKIMNCVDTFRACVEREANGKLNKETKKALQTFISGLVDHYPDLNVALKKGVVIDLESHAFTEIRNFLRTLATA